MEKVIYNNKDPWSIFENIDDDDYERWRSKEKEYKKQKDNNKMKERDSSDEERKEGKMLEEIEIINTSSNNNKSKIKFEKEVKVIKNIETEKVKLNSNYVNYFNRSEIERQKEDLYRYLNINTINALGLRKDLKEGFLHSNQPHQTNLDNYINPSFNYPQKKIELLTLPRLIEGKILPFSISETNNRIISNTLTNHHPKKEGIFAHDAHFIFAVSIFIITAIIIAYILLINYNDLHLQKEEKKMNKDKEKYLISFQKGYQLNSYLFYTGIGFISISIFILSLLAVRNVIFPDSDIKKNEKNKI